MKPKTMNAEILATFEDKIIDHMPPSAWHAELEVICDKLTSYMVYDPDYIGNDADGNTLFHLRHLRDFFKDLDDLAH